MPDLTNKDIMNLGRDLNKAKIEVLAKYGFTYQEIANVIGTTENVIRKIQGNEL